MEHKHTCLEDTCNFMGIRPAIADLPYPPIQVKCKSQAYANLLSIDYCGSVSELSAITQYINNESRISLERCSVAKTILGIAMAVGIESEKAAINQYQMHIKMMDDPYINSVLARIIRDEEYHIMILQALWQEEKRNMSAGICAQQR